MADAKLTALTEDTGPGSDSIVYGVDDPGGTPASRKMTLANLRKGTHPGSTSTTDNAVARYNGTAGDLQDSGITIDDSNNIVGAVDIDGDTVSGAMIATQAEQETGTSVDSIVTPGRQHFHPSAAKGWAFAGVTGNLVVSYNVSSATDNGTGDVTIGWDTDFSTDNYVPVVVPITSGANATRIAVANAGATQVICFNTSTGTATDPSGYFIVAFGDHA